MVRMISIIINHYRTPDLLKLCIRSIKENLAHIPHEIIVRDGEALEETRDLMRENFPDTDYFPEAENVGFAKLVNDGILKAKGEYLLILNADIIIPKGDAVLQLVRYLEQNPRCGMVGPRLHNLNGTLQPSCFRFYKPLTLFYRRTFLSRLPFGRRDIRRFMYSDIGAMEQKKPFPVDWLMGSAMLVRKAAIDEVGMFDDRFFMYFEDVDWCRRFWEKEWQVIYYPQAMLYHYHGQASRGKKGLFEVMLNKYTRIHITSAVKFFWKHGLKVPQYGV